MRIKRMNYGEVKDPVPKALLALIKQIEDPSIQKIVLKLIKKPQSSLREFKNVSIPFNKSPAGISIHHCYEGGLVEHVIASSKIALSLCDVVENVYGGKVNRDIVLAGAILHDIFKASTYEEKPDKTYGLSMLGEKLDHLTLIACELFRKVPLELLHTLIAHHGREGPMAPRSIEALIVHLADTADSRLNAELLSMAKHIIKECTGEEVKGLTAREALRIIFAKQKGGWKEVIKEIEKLKKSNSVT